MRYRYLLVDNDNTLMDFDRAEALALAQTLRDLGLPADEAVCRLYHGINDALWKALERGETTQQALKVERFHQLLAELNRQDISAEAAAETFALRLGEHAELLPGALELLDGLRGKMRIALVSNGVSAIQRSRLSRCPFTPWLDAVMISEEIGASKPDPAMVEAALTALGCEDKAQAVLLGDSLTADIPAAVSAGIDSIYLDRHGRPSALPTYTVRSLDEAAALLWR